MLNKVKIPKRKLKGDDGHKIFSIRIPDDLYEELNSLASKTELSRNEINHNHTAESCHRCCSNRRCRKIKEMLINRSVFFIFL